MEEINSKANLWRAIRAKCLDCCGNYTKEVEHCHLKDCKLWPYRFGKAMAIQKRKLKKSQNT